MIIRLVEYGRYCDNEDCRLNGQTNVAGWMSRAECERAAEKDGWVRCTRNRWLCPECAAKLLPAEPTSL